MTTVLETPDATGVAATEEVGGFKLARRERNVFIGLMIGMLVGSISQTIVGPAMPRIVADLGGMEHYSWVATAAMLVTAITVPIVGKFSDLYGRRGFYLGGLLVFMIGSIVCGFAGSFWMLVVGRAIQGLGMGTIMPLSQTIVGDIIPPRHRGRYQGLMGAMFGVSSVVGPLAGGFITDHFGWRWLFFAAPPFGLAALVFLWLNLHLPHTPRKVRIDWAGMFTLTSALILILLATSWGGTTYAWGSATILGMYAVGAVVLAAFLFIEGRAQEPILPLSLFHNPIIALSNVANFLIAMVMFGAIFYIPVFAQGVLGESATGSSLVLTPLMLGMIVVSILAGLFITRTGRYKGIMLGGLVIMAAGQFLLSRLDETSAPLSLSLAMVVVGVGLGLCMQQYTLVIQNAVSQAELGVATASAQFFRNVGSTVGVAIFGTLMTSGLKEAIASHLPPSIAATMGDAGGGASTASVLDPEKLKALPAPIVEAIRAGLAERLHLVFLAGIPLTVLALVATIFIKAVPLRTSHETPAEQVGQELFDTMAQSVATGEQLAVSDEQREARTAQDPHLRS